MTKRPSLAANYYLCPCGESLGMFLDRLRAHGFTRVGLTERALEEAGNCEAIRKELTERGMSVSSVNSAGFFLADGEWEHSQARRNRELIRWTQSFEGAVLNIIIGGSPTLSLRESRSRATRGLLRLAADAAESGVRVVVEPLHMINIRGKSCLNTIHQTEDVFEILDRNGINNAALNLDLFHLWWDPDLDKLLAGHSIPVGLLQVCDVWAEQGALPRRVPLDEGHIDWQGAVEAVRYRFPDTTVELELFIDQLPERDINTILLAAQKALRVKKEAYGGDSTD